MFKRQFTIAVLFLSLFCFLESESKADDTPKPIYTPRGTLVGDSYETDEFIYPETREYWDNYFASAYPNATQLTLWGEQYSSSRRYNCHGYAWHMIGDDEINDPVWIGWNDPGNTYKYWDDGSYSEVDVQYATMVDYSGDHSATTTDQTDIYISKWNKYPLMRHYKTYCPDYGTPVKFLRKNPLVPQDYSTIQAALNAAVPGQTVYVSSGTYTENNDLTVSGGITLTFSPGVTFRMASSKKLIVYGTLNAEGTSSNPITFTKSSANKWWGIRFEDSSNNCRLDYCTVEQSYYGVYSVSSEPTIRHCTFQNNGYGVYCIYPGSNHSIDYNTFSQNSFSYDIYLYRRGAEVKYNTIQSSNGYGIACNQSNITTTPRFYGNNIKNHTTKGIYLYDSDPVIVQNNVYDNYDGMYFTGYSYPEFRDWDDEPGHNVIVDNSRYGIYVGSDAEPDLGGTAFGYNSLYDNGSYNLYSLVSWQLDATYNYWGGGAPSGVYGNVSTTPYLTTNPNPGEPPGMPKLIAINTDGLTSGQDGDLQEHYQRARALEKSRQYHEAILEYQWVIDNYPDSGEAKSALVHLSKCYKRINALDALSTVLQEISSDYANKEIGAMAAFANITRFVEDKEINSALSICSQISTQFSGTTLGRDALFESWLLHFNITHNLKTAHTIMEEYEKTYGIDDNLVFMKFALGEITPEIAANMTQQTINKSDEEPSSHQVESGMPEIFELLSNYPNPFNPETTIPFAVPEAAHVRIDIYSVQGRLVATLTDRDYAAGWHKVPFRATAYSSGIYFIRVEMKSNDDALFSKVFTNKMMLLK